MRRKQSRAPHAHVQKHDSQGISQVINFARHLTSHMFHSKAVKAFIDNFSNSSSKRIKLKFYYQCLLMRTTKCLKVIFGDSIPNNWKTFLTLGKEAFCT